jgi:hypothetical protein
MTTTLLPAILRLGALLASNTKEEEDSSNTKSPMTQTWTVKLPPGCKGEAQTLHVSVRVRGTAGIPR